MDEKVWWKSKTIWANVVALIAIVAQGVSGNEILIDAEAQAGLLAVVNVVLRIITTSAVTLATK